MLIDIKINGNFWRWIFIIRYSTIYISNIEGNKLKLFSQFVHFQRFQGLPSSLDQYQKQFQT